MDSSAPEQPARKQRILIVDDDETLLRALEMTFAARGKEVEARSTFETARKALRTARFDALLTDVRLGAFNGLQLAVIARDEQPHIRIVVFSGFSDPVLEAEAHAVGAEYVVKPVTAAELSRLLDGEAEDS